MAKNKTNLTEKQIEEEAYKVIRGDYGNGDARKEKLGDNYSAVQNKVNQLSKQAGGVSNVKTPSTSVSTPKSTSQTVKTTTDKSKTTSSASSVANKNNIKTSSTANPKYNTKTDTSNTNTSNKKNASKIDTTKKSSTTVNGTLPFLSSEYKNTDVANANTSSTGKVQTLEKNKNLITLEKADGTTKQVETKTVNNPKISLTDDEYKVLKDVTNHMGEGNTAIKLIDSSKVSGGDDIVSKTKAIGEKYGVSTSDLFKAYSEEKSKKDKEFGEAHPILASLKTTLQKSAQTPIENAFSFYSNYLTPNGRAAEDTNAHMKARNSEIADTRSGVKENLGEAGQNVYDLVSGVADRIGAQSFGKAISGGNPIVGAAFSGLNTMGDYLSNAQDRGVDNRKAAATGMVNGLVDATLDVMGLDKVGALQPTGQIAKDIAKKFGIGAGEQGITYIIQEVTDNLVNGKDSVYSNNKQNYMAQGMSESGATKQAFVDEAVELGKETATGGLFSVGMDAINKGVGKILGGNKITDTNVKNNDVEAAKQGEITDNNVKTKDNITPEQQAELDAQLDNDITNLLNNLDNTRVADTIPVSDTVGTPIVTDANGNRIVPNNGEKITSSDVNNNGIPSPKNLEGKKNTEPTVKNTIANETVAQDVLQDPISQHYETLKRSDMFKSAENQQKLEAARKDGVFDKKNGVESRATSMNEAAEEYARNPERVRDEILNNEWTEGGKDLDKSMMILHDELDKNYSDTTKINQFLRNQTEKLTNAGRELRAVRDYVGTKEGTLQKTTEFLHDKSNELLDSNKNPKASSRINRVAKECMDGDFTHLKSAGMDNEAIDSIQKAIQNGSNESDIARMIATWESVGRTQISESALARVNEIYDQIERGGYGINSRQRAQLEAQAYSVLAQDIGGKRTFKEQWDAWRYLAMLGNTRTHIRNVLGNTTHYMLTESKDNLAAAIESAVDKVADIDRTKSVLNRFSKADNDLISRSRADADAEAYRMLNDTGHKYNDVKGLIEGARNSFNNKVLNAINDFNSNALEGEDYFGLKNKYSKSLARYLKANGYDTRIFDATDDASREVLRKAREYAVDEAKQATFHDYSRLADKLTAFSSGMRNGNLRDKAVGVALEGLMPFKKTPINILKQSIKYSPVSLVKAIGQGMDAIKTGKSSASDVIDSLASGLTGTGIVALGGFLASQGILNGNANENYNVDNAETQQGKQNYSIQIGDKSYTLDWLAPVSLPLFVGVEAFNQLAKSRDGELSFDDFVSALTTIGEPITEMSMLQGINDALSQLSNGVDSAIATLGTNMATSYVTQGVPTLLGQIARSVDPIRRSTYSDKNAGFGKQLDRQITKATNKIPFLSSLNEPYVDANGQTQENYGFGGTLAGRLAYNMLSPGYYASGNPTSTDKMLNDVYATEQDGNVYPSVSNGKVGDVKLSKEDFTKYQTMYGQNNRTATDMLANNTMFNELPTGDKNEIIKDAYSYSKAFANYEVGDKEFTSNKEAELYEKYKEGGMQAVIDSMMEKVEFDNFATENGFVTDSGNVSTAKETYLSYVESKNPNASDEEKGRIFVEEWKKGKGLSEADQKIYNEGGYAAIWNKYNSEKNTSKNVKSDTIPVENTTSNVKTIPSPSSLGNTASSNMIRQNVERMEAEQKAEEEHQQAIANFDLGSYTSGTSNGGTRFNEKEGLPALKEVYKTDAERSQALIDGGVSTKGVNKTREVFGDDYVYTYYEIKAGADANGDSHVTKKELVPYLQSQGMSQAEIDKWWSVYK